MGCKDRGQKNRRKQRKLHSLEGTPFFSRARNHASMQPQAEKDDTLGERPPLVSPVFSLLRFSLPSKLACSSGVGNGRRAPNMPYFLCKLHFFRQSCCTRHTSRHTSHSKMRCQNDVCVTIVAMKSKGCPPALVIRRGRNRGRTRRTCN